VLALLIVIETVNRVSSAWNCKEQYWTLNFNDLQPANILINPYKYLNCELFKVFKGHLEEKGDNVGY